MLTANGNIVLGGTLRVTLIDGFVPSPTTVFQVVQCNGGITGAFANVANGQRLTTADGLGSFLVNIEGPAPFPTFVRLRDFRPTVPGDFDVDGDVDGADFLVWQRSESPTPLSNADLAAWKTNFGAGASTPAAVAVPEPRSAAGFIAAFVALRMSRRRTSVRPSRNPRKPSSALHGRRGLGVRPSLRRGR